MNSTNNTPRRLLVIDDEANMRHMLSTVLKKAGYVVETAADSAIDHVQSVGAIRCGFIGP